MEILISVIVFIYGLVFGSFFNVVGYRLPNNLSIMNPRGSFCPKCHHELRWFELIPVLSFLIQKGRCRKCKDKISLFYPIIELSTGILFLLSYLTFGLTTEFVISLLISSYLIIVVVSDGRYMIIPDEVTLFFSIALLIVELLTYGPKDTLVYLASGLALFGIIFVFMKITSKVFKKDSLGGGDIKLEFFSGAALGITNGLFSIFIASLIALPVSLYKLNKKKSNMIAFGPFLLLGVLIIYLFKIDIVKIIKDLTYMY